MSRIARFSLMCLAFLGLTMGFQSCGKKGAAADGAAGDLTQRVPSSAFMVGTVNTKQIMAKLDYNAMKSMEFFKEQILAEAPASAKPFLENPAETGVDLEGKMMFYVEPQFLAGKEPGDRPRVEMLAVFLIPIKDAAKFEALIAKNPKTAQAADKGGYKQVNDDRGAVVAWSKDLMVVAASDREELKTAAEAAVAKAFKPDPANNISQNADFKKRQAEGKDAMLWIGTDALVKQLMAAPDGAQLKQGLAAMQLPEDALMGNYFAAYYDFQNGKIESGVEFTLNPALVKEFGPMFKSKPDTDFGKFFPAQGLVMAGTVGMNSAAIVDFVTKRGLNSLADAQLSRMGVTFAELVGSFKGDMGFAMYEDGTAFMPAVVFSVPLTNKAAAEKLIASMGPAAQRQGEIVKMGPAEMVLRDDLLLVSMKAGVSAKVAAGGYSGGEAADLSAIQGSVGGMWIDYAAMGRMQLKNSFRPNDPTATFLASGEITTLVGTVNPGISKGVLSLKATDKNSLKRLSEIVNELYLAEKKSRDVIQ